MNGCRKEEPNGAIYLIIEMTHAGDISLMLFKPNICKATFSTICPNMTVEKFEAGSDIKVFWSAMKRLEINRIIYVSLKYINSSELSTKRNDTK